MRTKAPYSPCKLFIDGLAGVLVGDYLETQGGSAYLVLTVRQNRNRPLRRHLECLRWPAHEVPTDAKVHMLYWYPRKRRARTLTQVKRLAADSPNSET